jgi:hypothetical protein
MTTNAALIVLGVLMLGQGLQPLVQEVELPPPGSMPQQISPGPSPVAEPRPQPEEKAVKETAPTKGNEASEEAQESVETGPSRDELKEAAPSDTQSAPGTPDTAQTASPAPPTAPPPPSDERVAAFWLILPGTR